MKSHDNPLFKLRLTAVHRAVRDLQKPLVPSRSDMSLSPQRESPRPANGQRFGPGRSSGVLQG